MGRNGLRLGRRTLVVAVAAVAVVALLVAYDIEIMMPPSSQNPIKHVVVLMQENRTFDNYFWTYPGQVGYDPNLCMPLDPAKADSGCMKPSPATTAALIGDLPHDWSSTNAAYANGSMNGFLSSAHDNPAVMAYYDNSSLPNLWAYAKHYVLADRFFTSAKSYSQPNHWYMIAGTSPQVSLFQGMTQEKKACYDQATKQLTMSTCDYINEAQGIKTMSDELTSYGISWKYYDQPIPKGATLAGAIAGTCRGCNPWAYWNPLDAKNSSYTDPTYGNNLVARERFFWDVGNGTLPQVSWIIPSGGLSDHPPANVTLGMWWITDVVNTVMKSNYWQNTAIFVLWDDYGGFFDTVAPPPVDGYGLSFRTPALIISAYAKAGYLDHTIYGFESTLKFIEWSFGVPPLGARDSAVSALRNPMDAFDFAGQANPPYLIPLSSSQLGTIQPYILQGSNPNPNPTGAQLGSPAFIGNNPD
jgi:phospholipase C